MTRTCFVLLLAAACGSKPAPVSSTATPPTSSFHPAAHYAALFQRGASWTYAVTSTKGHDSKDWKATCKVTNVREVSVGIASEIDCDIPQIAGTWVANARGLWRVEDPANIVLEGDHAWLIIAAEPTASSSVVKRGDSWCESVWGPDNGPGTHDELCFGAKGIVQGLSEFMPGAEQDRETEAFSL
jgi:hypothetical protein